MVVVTETVVSKLCQHFCAQVTSAILINHVFMYFHFFFFLQRDLDFTVDFEYKGELSEACASLDYKMR